MMMKKEIKFKNSNFIEEQRRMKPKKEKKNYCKTPRSW